MSNKKIIKVKYHCNEEKYDRKKTRFFCPKMGWFMSEKCNFLSKDECDFYERWCCKL
jgi:hypothetical protein